MPTKRELIAIFKKNIKTGKFRDGSKLTKKDIVNVKHLIKKYEKR